MGGFDLRLLWIIYFHTVGVKICSGIKAIGSPFAGAAMIRRQGLVYNHIVLTF